MSNLSQCFRFCVDERVSYNAGNTADFSNVAREHFKVECPSFHLQRPFCDTRTASVLHTCPVPTSHDCSYIMALSYAFIILGIMWRKNIAYVPKTDFTSFWVILMLRLLY